MKKITYFVLLSFSLSIISPLITSLHVVKQYTYDSESSVVSLSFEDAPEPTAQNGETLRSKTFWKQARGGVQFASKQDMFTLKIPKTFTLESGDTPIRISLMVDGEVFPLTIDMDGDGRDESYYYTQPIFLSPTDHISYSIEGRSHIQIPGITFIGLDTEAANFHMALDTDTARAAVGSTHPDIIKRADWGADESLRYRDSPTWQKIFKKLEAEESMPKSEATLAYEARTRDIRSYLATNFPEQDQPVETIRTEGEHELVWPIEKTKQVERIVIHHTAEDNKKDRDDLSLIRGIYYYHTVVRGWGDIGYNYLIGQRGKIYEGRAGGDYVVAAHAVWNNKSSVGVSVMGNFMQDAVVSQQEEALKNIVEYLSKKYGIDIHKTSTGHKECKKGDCLLNDFPTPNLAGHRDVGFTSCPGDHLLSLVQEIAQTDTASSARTLVINPKYDAKKALSIGSTKETSASLDKGPNVRIRLSYTGSSINFKSGDTTRVKLTIGKHSGVLKKNPELTFEPMGTDKIALVLGKKKYTFSNVSLEANLVTITSWDRKPTWDTSGTMNDNTFRGKILLLNEGGKLVVVNELPIEDYLRGLAETSNGDNEEKVKTILVAARSYAYFYTKPENRKFPGKDYDGSDNPDEFQKYLGYGYEKRSPNNAHLVDVTRGQIITYEGNPIKPWYFSESNGQTLSYKQYCENRVKNGTLGKGTQCEDIPYFQSVTDPGGVGHIQKGHGVGISGIGATYLATNMGFTYEQIIAYYLDGTKVEKRY